MLRGSYEFSIMQASSDMSILDFNIPYSIALMLANGIEVIAIIAIMATVTWQVLVVAVPVLTIIVYAQVSVNFFQLFFKLFLQF